MLSGPSGVGKGTICKELFASNPNLCYSVSATTRAPRAGESDGVSYYFMSREAFNEKVEQGGFLEWAELFGNCYGTPAFAVDERLQQGRSVVLEIDTQGALQVMKQRPDCVSVFILPPSMDELTSRIRGRATENDEEIDIRLRIAFAEIAMAEHYKYQVVNAELKQAVAEIENIFRAEGIIAAE